MRRVVSVALSALSLTAFSLALAPPSQAAQPAGLSEQISSLLTTPGATGAATSPAQSQRSTPGLVAEAAPQPQNGSDVVVTVASWPADPVLQSNAHYPIAIHVDSGASPAAGLKVGFQYLPDGGTWTDAGLPLGGPATFTPGRDIPTPTYITPAATTDASGNANATLVAPTAAQTGVTFRAVVLGKASTPATSGAYDVVIGSNSLYNPPAYSNDPNAAGNAMPTQPGVLIKAQKLDPAGATIEDQPLQYPGIAANNPLKPAEPLVVPQVAGAGAPPCFYRQVTSDPCVVGSTDGNGNTLPSDKQADQYRILYSDQRFIPNPPPFTDQRSLGRDQEILEAASALVIVPKNATASSKVVAWDHPTIGQADQCSVTRGFALIDMPVIGGQSNGGAQINAGDMSFFMEQTLAAGNIIVMPDYMGIGVNGPTQFKKSYAIGQQEARDNFYAIKALQATAGKVPGWNGVGAGDETWTGTDFVAMGHSQGGHAAMWTGVESQRDWAKRLGLNLKGVVAAAPATDLVQIVSNQWEGYAGWVLGPELIQTYVSISPELTAFGLSHNVLTETGMAELPYYTTLCTTQAFADSTRFVPKGINFLQDPADPKYTPSYAAWAPLFGQQTPIPTYDPNKPDQNSFPRDLPFLLLSGTADNIVVSQINAAMQQAFCLMDDASGKPVVPFRASWSPTMTGLNTPPAVSFTGSFTGNTLIVDSLTGGTGAPYTKIIKAVSPASSTQAFQNLGKVNVGDTLVSYGPDANTQTPAPADIKVASIDYNTQVVTFNQAITPTGTTLVFQPRNPGPLAVNTEVQWVVGTAFEQSVQSATITALGTGKGGVGTYQLDRSPDKAPRAGMFQVESYITGPGAASPVSNQQAPDHLNPLTFPFTTASAAGSIAAQAVSYAVVKESYISHPVVLYFDKDLPAEFVAGANVVVSNMPLLKKGKDTVDPNGNQKLTAVNQEARTVTFSAGGLPDVTPQTVLKPMATVATDAAVTYNNAPSELLGFTADVFAGKEINADCHEVDEQRPTSPPGAGPSQGMTWYDFPNGGFSPTKLPDPSKEIFYKSWGSGALPPPTDQNAQPALGLLFLNTSLEPAKTTAAESGCALTWKPVTDYAMNKRPPNPDCTQYGLWPYGKFTYSSHDVSKGLWGTYPNNGQQQRIPVGPSAGQTVYVPIDPTRVCDTRLACPGASVAPVPGGGSITFDLDKGINVQTGQIVKNDVIPADATAVAYNITAINTSSRGWFAVMPPSEASASASSINWPDAGQVVANGLTVKSGPERQTKVQNGAATATDMAFDVVGYFIDPAKAVTPGQLFHPMTPQRVFDSRTSGPGGTPDPIQPGDQNSRVVKVNQPLPADAKAVAYNIVAVDTPARGFFAVTPGDVVTYDASTINWAGPGYVIANGQFSKIANDGTIRVFNGSSLPTNAIIDITGYFTDEASSFSGNYFFPIVPARAYDSRAPQPQPGALNGGSSINVSLADGRNLTTGAVERPNVVPSDATAVNYNITAINTTSRGWFEVAPSGTPPTGTSSINWPWANDVIGNGLTVGLGLYQNPQPPNQLQNRSIRVTSGASGPTNLTVDTYGYFR